MCDYQLFSLNTDLCKLISSSSDIVEVKKIYSKFYKAAKENVKQDCCLLCGKKGLKFCNSHSIPQFILESISSDGLYLNINTFLEIPIIKSKIGKNEANTFHLICRDCDKKYFATYENPNNYDNEISQRMLAEISLKDSLRMQWKQRLKTAMDVLIANQTTDPLTYQYAKVTHDANQLDLHDFQNSFLLALKTIEKKTNGYFLIDSFVVDYVTKIAFQGQVALVTGFDDELINNPYNMDQKYKTQFIHICIFPINNKTHIFLFIEDGDTRYRNFYRHFRKLSKEQKLIVINYILVLYSEEWLLASSANKELFNNEELKRIMRTIQTPHPCSCVGFSSKTEYSDFILKKALEVFTLKNIPSIPNFLLPNNDNIV